TSRTALLAGSDVHARRRRSQRPSEHELTSIELQLSSQISAKGVGIGYLSGLLVQCIGIVILLLMGGTTSSQRIVLFIIGLWWTVFTIPAAMWLRPRPGPPLPDRLLNGRGGARAWFSYFKYSWTSLYR